jgi:hypothetical protein
VPATFGAVIFPALGSLQRALTVRLVRAYARGDASPAPSIVINQVISITLRAAETRECRFPEGFRKATAFRKFLEGYHAKEDADRELRAIHDARKLRAIERLRIGYRELTNELLIGTYIGRERLREKCRISMTPVILFFPMVEALERASDPADTKPRPVKPGSAPDPLSPRVSAALSNVLTALTAVSDCVVAEFASVRSEDFIRLEGLLAAQKVDYDQRLFLAAEENADLAAAAVAVVGESDDTTSSAHASEKSAATAAVERDQARDQLREALAANKDLEAKVYQFDQQCGFLEKDNDFLRRTIEAFGRRGEPR